MVAKAKAQVEQLMQTEGVTLPAPTEPFDPGKKRVAVVLAGQDAGFDAMNDGVHAAAKTMGWTVGPSMDGKFSPTDQAGFIQQAVQEKYDAIILLVIDAATVESALTAANKANIPVACVMCDNEGYEGKIYDVTTGGYPAGQAMAQYVIADSAGKQRPSCSTTKASRSTRDGLPASRTRSQRTVPTARSSRTSRRPLRS